MHYFVLLLENHSTIKMVECADYPSAVDYVGNLLQGKSVKVTNELLSHIDDMGCYVSDEGWSICIISPDPVVYQKK